MTTALVADGINDARHVELTRVFDNGYQSQKMTIDVIPDEIYTDVLPQLVAEQTLAASMQPDAESLRYRASALPDQNTLGLRPVFFALARVYMLRQTLEQTQTN